MSSREVLMVYYICIQNDVQQNRGKSRSSLTHFSVYETFYPQEGCTSM